MDLIAILGDSKQYGFVRQWPSNHSEGSALVTHRDCLFTASGHALLTSVACSICTRAVKLSSAALACLFECAPGNAPSALLAPDFVAIGSLGSITSATKEENVISLTRVTVMVFDFDDDIFGCFSQPREVPMERKWVVSCNPVPATRNKVPR